MHFVNIKKCKELDINFLHLFYSCFAFAKIHSENNKVSLSMLTGESVESELFQGSSDHLSKNLS